MDRPAASVSTPLNRPAVVRRGTLMRLVDRISRSSSLTRFVVGGLILLGACWHAPSAKSQPPTTTAQTPAASAQTPTTSTPAPATSTPAPATSTPAPAAPKAVPPPDPQQN